MSRSSFHLRQVSVKFRLHKWPRRYDRGFTAQHSGHTSSISGDHRAALPGGVCADGWTEAGAGAKLGMALYWCRRINESRADLWDPP